MIGVIAGFVAVTFGVYVAWGAVRRLRFGSPPAGGPPPRTGWFDASRSGRASRAAFLEIPALADATLAGVLAGQGLVEALEAAAGGAAMPLRTHLTPLRRALRLGTPLRDALQAVRPVGPLAHFASAITLAHETGGDAGPALRRFASATRDAAEVAREARALSATARAQARVLAVLPVAVLGLTTVADPHHLVSAVASAPGRAAIATGLLLDAAGLVVIRRLTKARL